MLRLNLAAACLVAQPSALALQPVSIHSTATIRSDAAVRSAVAMAADPDATRDPADAPGKKAWQLDGVAAFGEGEDLAEKGDPTLSPEQQAQLVLPEESFKVEKLEMSQTDEEYASACRTKDLASPARPIKTFTTTHTIPRSDMVFVSFSRMSAL